jgi:hypothetical protein
MAYTTPTTASGQVLTSSIWNASVRDNLEYLKDRVDNPPRVRAYHSTTQSIANASATVVTLNSEHEDAAGMHDTAVNTGRLTVPTGQGGWYMVVGFVEFAANATGQRTLQIRTDGVDIRTGVTTNAASSGTTQLTVALLWNANAASYFELIATQNSGGALNIGGQRTYFIASRVA